MGCRVLRRLIWGFNGCLCPTKGTPGLNESTLVDLIVVILESFPHEGNVIESKDDIVVLNLGISFSLNEIDSNA